MNMQVPRCIASEMMTDLLVWRNPQGEERNWQNYELVNNEFEFPIKVTATFFALPIVEIIATIETVVYAILASVSILFLPFDDEPFLFFAEALSSSLITQFWAIADVIANLFCINVLTHESFVRHNFLPFAIRDCDQNYVENNSGEGYRRLNQIYQDDEDGLRYRYLSRSRIELMDGHHNPLNAYRSSAAANNVEVPDPLSLAIKGKKFLQDFVLKGQSEHTKELFEEQDADIVPFILSRAIGIYLVGEKKDDAIPDFFKPSTRVEMLGIRRELNIINKRSPAEYAALVEELNKCIENPSKLDGGSQVPLANRFLRGERGKNGIQSLGNNEMQGVEGDDVSTLLTKSWRLALTK